MVEKNYNSAYETPLKLQKILVFYELLTKVAGESPDFSHLRGYKRGPVFSNVWGDYTKERSEFNREVDKAYKNNNDSVNQNRAQKCAFLVSTLSEKELSELTHRLHFWSAKEDRIMSNEYQVDLDESDFNENDERIINLLYSMYPIDMIENSEIIDLNSKYFVLSKSDFGSLTANHIDTLSILSEQEELNNPVYIELDEDGRLLVD